MAKPTSNANDAMLSDISGGSFWITLSTVLNRVTIALVTIPVARFLGKEDYGLYSLVASTLMVFATFGATGFGALSNRYIAELKFTDLARVGRIITLCLVTVAGVGTIAFLIMFLAADWIATDLLHRPELASLFHLAAVGLYGIALSALSRGILGGFRAYSIQTLSQGLGIITAPILLGLGCFFFGLRGAVGGFAINHAVMGLATTALAFVVIRRRNIRLDFAGVASEFPLLRMYWLPAMLGSAVVVPAVWILNLILAGQPESDAMIGACAAALQFRLIMGIIPMAMGQVFFTQLSEITRAKDSRRYDELYDLSLRLTILVAVPIALAGILGAKSFMFLFGRDFVSDWPVVGMMGISGVFLLIGATIGQLLASSNRMWLSFSMNAFWLLLIVVLAWWLIPRYGAMGFALAHAGSYAIHLAISYLVFHRVLRVQLLPGGLSALVRSGAIIAVAVVVAPLLSIWGGALAGIVAALGAVVAGVRFGLSADERATLAELGASKWRSARSRLRPAQTDLQSNAGCTDIVE